DWSSDVCSSDLAEEVGRGDHRAHPHPVIPSPDFLRRRLLGAVEARVEQGADPGTLREEIRRSDHVEELAALGRRIRTLPLRHDWPCVEPETFEDILAECDVDALPAAAHAVAADD